MPTRSHHPSTSVPGGSRRDRAAGRARISHHDTSAPRTCPRGEGGYILVKFSLLLVPLLLMSGLSVDVGSWYSRASDIQKAADAAALAGVVWLPDLEEAEDHALEAATRNGFTDGIDDIEIDVEQVGERRLRVTIYDGAVGSFFFENLGGRDIDLTRAGTAEYVLPVPMGSPRNYFGLGRLPTSSNPELLYQSVNPACTNKVNGDRHQSLHFDGSSTILGSCSSTPSNEEYKPRGYSLYVEAPEDRQAPIDVMLYDPRYSTSNVTKPRECSTVYPSGWTGPGSFFGNTTVTGPAIYQTRSFVGWSVTDWSEDKWLPAGNSITSNGYLIRYKKASETCTPSSTEGAIDSKRQSGEENFTFSLYAADDTPLTDDDNPLVPGCSKVYQSDTAFDIAGTYLGSARWNVLCTIQPNMPDGRYILRVQNDGANSESGDDGSNQWGLVAKYKNATANNGLCDGRNDPLCPRVYGRDAISVYANTSAGVASFFLAEIEEEHNGKTLELELWDPGEGGSKIEFLRPNGTDSWTPARFSWDSFRDNGTADRSGPDTFSVDVTNDKFDGRLLRIRIRLDDYAPPADNRWWKIRYTFASAPPGVTDRTTWSARVVGDPVHLVEDEAP